MLRKKFELETARVILGHRSSAITEVYAEMDQHKTFATIVRVEPVIIWKFWSQSVFSASSLLVNLPFSIICSLRRYIIFHYFNIPQTAASSARWNL